MRTILAVVISCLLAVEVFAHCTYTGRSGAPGLSTTCASSCHGSPGGTMTVTGFPASYTPGQSYLLTVSRVSGAAIENFNASCRVGTGSVNAGVIAAGTNTSTYNVTNETNGVHFTACAQTSGTFNWTAPAAGTGTVRLYAAGMQSTGSSSGLNTALVLVSDEAVAAPPTPQGLVIKSDAAGSSLVLNWNPSTGAGHYYVYRDLTPGFVPGPGNLIGTVTDTTFSDTENPAGYALRFYVVTASTP